MLDDAEPEVLLQHVDHVAVAVVLQPLAQAAFPVPASHADVEERSLVEDSVDPGFIRNVRPSHLAKQDQVRPLGVHAREDSFQKGSAQATRRYDLRHSRLGGVIEHTSPFLAIPAAERLIENELAFAIWDGFPVTPGHALLVTKRVARDWFDATPAERDALLALVEPVRTIILERHSPDGYNIGWNVGPAAGQTVAHLHVHVIPRYVGDVVDPRGGLRHVIPAKANYLREEESGDG